MKIGVISDSHDNLPKIKDVIKELNARGIRFLLHAGDFVAPFSLAPLQDLHCDWMGVFGNNDGERQGLNRASGGRVKEGPISLSLEHKTITLMHEFRESPGDIVIYGHTHKPHITRGRQLLINPGEVCGWLTQKSSFALVDLENLAAEIIYF